MLACSIHVSNKLPHDVVGANMSLPVEMLLVSTGFLKIFILQELVACYDPAKVIAVVASMFSVGR